MSVPKPVQLAPYLILLDEKLKMSGEADCSGITSK
jgi:hypothetical protein